MLHIILTILMWFLIAILVLVVCFWIYGMITSKEYRKWFWEESVRRAKEDERKRNRPYESEYYKRTGCRNFLSRGGRKI